MTFECIVVGKVQGVYYRASVQEKASKNNFNGYIENLSNGDVRAFVNIDNMSELDSFHKILLEGSKESIVEDIRSIQVKEHSYDGFSVQ